MLPVCLPPWAVEGIRHNFEDDDIVLIVQLAQIERSAQVADTLDVAWQKTSATRRREMLLHTSDPRQ